MKTKLLFTIATAAMLLAACSNDENEVNNGPIEARITAGIDGPVTRAIEQEWKVGNTIGVMVTSSTSGMNNLYKNVKYTVENAGATGTFTTAGQGIFFQDASATETFAAYSPYQSSADAATLPETDGTVTGVNTQDQTTQEKQETFDYLFAKDATASKSSPTVLFKGENQFKHQMARLILVLQTSTADGFTADQVQKGTYKLGGLIHNGTFNVINGEAQAASESAVSDWDITDNFHVDGSPKDARTYTMILYPQTLSSALTFSATINGQTYTNTATIQPALDAGNSYTYTITMKKTGLTVSGCTIAAWGSGTTGSGDATMP